MECTPLAAPSVTKQSVCCCRENLCERSRAALVSAYCQRRGIQSSVNHFLNSGPLLWDALQYLFALLFSRLLPLNVWCGMNTYQPVVARFRALYFMTEPAPRGTVQGQRKCK
jgi:hypothetical protein